LNGRTLIVSFGSFHQAEIIRTERWSWQQFTAFLTRSPPISPDKAAHGWYIPAEFEPEYRHSNNFLTRHALTFDYDRIEPSDVGGIIDVFKPYAFCAYSTASYTPLEPRIRVVMPTDRPMGFDEFQAVARRVASWWNIGKIAKESFPPAQMMYCPTIPGTYEFQKWVNLAPWLVVDTILESYDDWTDRASWPCMDGDRPSGANAVSPLEKPGIIGLWCRTFTVEDCIEKFELPYTKVND